MRRRFQSFVIALFAGIVSSSIFAASPAASAAAPGNAETLAAIRSTLEKSFPDKKVIDVQAAPVAGLYEVYAGDSIVYADSTADHLFVGSLLDTRTQRDLTAERLEERQIIDFDALPFNAAVKTVRGSGAGRLAVFTDPDCPYCRDLEKQLASLQDVTIFTFLLPVVASHPDAPAKARAIWCAPDASRAWSRWMLEGELPAASACESAPLEPVRNLSERLYVTGTPTVFFTNGRRIAGVPTAEQLRTLLRERKAPTGAINQ
jgi:thiol:disulfide interchange protein DsbC